ncbi:MAG: T3SS effector HopA1 family protein [Phormidesmis sp.]
MPSKEVAPQLAMWAPNEDNAIAFADLPAPFARSYLRLRLRDFLYETFCLPQSLPPQTDETLLANDRVSGGLHTGLLAQFQQCNYGQGYFDPGWRVIESPDTSQADGTLAVEKYGVILHVERSRHLHPDQPALQRTVNAAHPAPPIPIKFPNYRFEPGYYIAIGDCGPPHAPATEIYFSAAVAAVPTLMSTLTTKLNRTDPMPYTLQAPYEPEDYWGPEAMTLRIEKRSLNRLRPLLKQIRAQHTNLELRPESPIFARTLEPGIAIADVIDSACTDGFGSSAELSRVERVADALVEHWDQEHWVQGHWVQEHWHQQQETDAIPTDNMPTDNMPTDEITQSQTAGDRLSLIKQTLAEAENPTVEGIT